MTRAIEIVVDAARLNADYATVLDATAAGLRMFPGDEHFWVYEDLSATKPPLQAPTSYLSHRLTDDGLAHL